MTGRPGVIGSVAATIVWWCAMSVSSLGQLQLKPPDIPSRFHTDRLVALEQQITKLNQQISEADKPTQLTLEASKSLRMIVRQLWLTGRASGDKGDRVCDDD